MSNSENTGVHNLRSLLTGLFQSERRQDVRERRRFTLKTLMVSAIRPRRRVDRRELDENHLDWHEPDLLFTAVTIILLSVVDAFFTVTLLGQGASEANPAMDWVLREHGQLFAAAKMALTGGGVIILVALARARAFRIVRVKTILHWCLLGYVCLFGYELWLLRSIL